MINMKLSIYVYSTAKTIFVSIQNALHLFNSRLWKIFRKKYFSLLIYLISMHDNGITSYM